MKHKLDTKVLFIFRQFQTGVFGKINPNQRFIRGPSDTQAQIQVIPAFKLIMKPEIFPLFTDIIFEPSGKIPFKRNADT